MDLPPEVEANLNRIMVGQHCDKLSEFAALMLRVIPFCTNPTCIEYHTTLKQYLEGEVTMFKTMAETANNLTTD